MSAGSGKLLANLISGSEPEISLEGIDMSRYSFAIEHPKIMARKCIASINLSAIKKNYLYAKSLAPQSQVIAVVKANAYGHGAIEVAHQLEG